MHFVLFSLGVVSVYVILDSNIYCADYLCRSAPFISMFNFLSNTGGILLLPRIVVQEVEKKRADFVAEQLKAVRSAFAALQKTSKIAPPELPAALTNEPYDLAALLTERIDDVQIVEYEALDHSAVVERALHVQRPFRPGEKGYRDTVLWLSFLRFLDSCPDGTEVAFINGNKHDFYAEDGKESKREKDESIEFHPDLQKDIDLRPGVTVHPYLSVRTFVDQWVDKNAHALDLVRSQDIFPHYLETEALMYMESLDESFLQTLSQAILPGTGVLEKAAAMSCELVEGLEDLDILGAEPQQGNDVYVSCTYNLRIVDFYAEIPESVFSAHKAAVLESDDIYEAIDDQEMVILRFVARVYFKASFMYNKERNESSGYSASASAAT